MKVFRATLLASVCALTTGVTSAPLLDVERSTPSVIVAVTPPTEPAVVAQIEPTTTTIDIITDGTIGS